MKRFRFTLNSVLTLRQREEQEATAKYAQALLAQNLVVTRLNVIEHELGVSREEMREAVLAGCNASKMAQALTYHRSVEKRRDDCVSSLRVAERHVNVTLQTMLKARQQSEVVQKFFDKQKKRFDYECAQEEQKFMDDLASIRSASSSLSWAST